MKLFMFVVNAIFWLWLFIVPVIVLGLAGWFIYWKTSIAEFFILFTITGIIAGFRWAEHVRKTKGLDNFFGSILSTPDIEDRSETYKVDDSEKAMNK